MDETLQSILETLPQKSPRSRLEPYHDLINELRRRGRTYREIERILVEQCHIQTSRSAINDFVRVRTRTKTRTSKRQIPESIETTAVSPTVLPDRSIKTNVANRENPSGDEIYRRIKELKRRPAVSQTTPEVFHYDPSKPLHITPKAEKSGSGK